MAAGLTWRAAATRSTWMAAFCGEMFGSRPDPDPVTASAGICEILTWSNAAICFCRVLIAWTSVGLFGPRLDAAVKTDYGCDPGFSAALTAYDGRGWKYCGSGLPLASVNSWHSRLEPTTRPW